MHMIQAVMLLGALVTASMVQVVELGYKTSPAKNLGPEKGVMRRDPSDIIKVDNLYYVWYTKGSKHSGYDATIWYATSPDGHIWNEKGEALPRGPEGCWDEQSVFTPNILVADGKYWLFYTAVPKPFFNSGPKITKTAIGIAVSDSHGTILWHCVRHTVDQYDPRDVESAIEFVEDLLSSFPEVG